MSLSSHVMRYRVPGLFACVLLTACAAPQPTEDRPAVPAERRPDRTMWEDAASQPLPPGVARVTIERYEVGRREYQSIRGAVDYDGEHVDVQAGSLGGANGLVLEGGAGDVDAALKLVRDSRYARSSSRQFLLINEGSTGSLRLLESQPQPWLAVIPIYRGHVLVRTVREQITGTGMQVAVQRAGPEAVTVRLSPYFHRANRRGKLVLEEIATALTLRPGRPYVIMQDRSHETSVASALLSRSTTYGARQVIAILTVDTGGSE